MLNLPFSDSSSAESFAVPAQLPEGVHTVTLTGLKLIQTKAGEDKLLVTYTGQDGEFADWLGFRSPGQTKRTYAYLCRLHELAGVAIPKGGKFDDEALIAAGNKIRIELQANDRGYLGLTDFPTAATATTDDDLPF